MEINIEKSNGQTLITVNGRLDTINAVSFQEQVDALADADVQNVVLECKDLEYICSSGLRAFISLLKRTKKKGGQIGILNLNNTVKEVFDMTGFSALFGL